MSEHVWSAEWNTLGFAIETRMERQRAELGAIVPTRQSLTTPSSTDPGKKARVRFFFTTRSLDADFHDVVAFSFVREGRSRGGGRKPSKVSSGVLRMRAASQGAWP